MLIPEILRLAVPGFSTATVCAELVLPTVRAPNLRAPEEKDTSGDGETTIN
jgi:hypothetical protein